MSKRSYYTTPLFVIVTCIALFVWVHTVNTTNYINEVSSLSLSKAIKSHRIMKEKYEEYKSLNTSQHIEMPESVRAVYMSSWVAGTVSLRNKLIAFVDDSDLNAIVIDIKDSTGVISFNIEDPLISSYGTTSNRISNIEELIADLHDRGIYIIGRISTFQDPLLVKKNPEFALMNIETNKPWVDRKGLAFLDPQNQKVWEYLKVIAHESYALGFDEINFDYIRYPSDGKISLIDYALKKDQTRRDGLKSFYQYVDENVRKKGIPISADIFGLVTMAEDDIGIGQYLEDIFPYFDAIAPMVYPSHYSAGFFGFSNPDEHPYEVVKKAMQAGIDRAIAIDEDPQKLRTWIQDFSLGVPYDIKKVRAQIDATYEIGLDSYMSWDPKNRYTKDAYYR